MAKHFTKACTANGYAAMGGSLKRPRIAKKGLRTVAESIAAARRAAAKAASIKRK